MGHKLEANAVPRAAAHPLINGSWRNQEMPDRQVSLELDPLLFGERERCVARSGKLTATAFRYRSGVAGLRVDNGAGTVVLLPFQGQQVWDATFLGRQPHHALDVRRAAADPRLSQNLWRTLPALRRHRRWAIRARRTRHPLHGELPNLPHTDAQLMFGEDDAGSYVELAGIARDTQAFHHDFVSRPRVRIREDVTCLDISVDVENRAAKPLPFLYLAHINFRPVDGAALLDTVRDDRADAIVRQPELAAGEREDVVAYHRAIAAEPAYHRTMRAGVPVQPELVLTMKAKSGADGWTHALHRHPDGTGDFVSYRPSELPYAVRWITRGPDQDALGLVLPATAAPDGLAAATASRQLVWVAPGASYRASLRFGAMDAAGANDLDATIKSIRDQ